MSITRARWLAALLPALAIACSGGDKPDPDDKKNPPAKFTVGGSVTGLAGTGLELELGDLATAAITANGPFTFDAELDDGASFEVTVSAQPAGPAQTCTVTGGQGTIKGAKVTDVQVSCTTNEYSVGGSVSGLVGSGLKLTNGDDELAIDADGAFTFPTKVASGEGFSVAISAQPENPSQTCTVSGAQGTVVAGDVATVVVSCETDKFTVGGTVTGLVGQGLKLRDGAREIAVNDEGQWAFPAVASGTAYEVVIHAQPTDPWQTCTLTNGLGTVGDANVTDIAIVCTTNEYSVKATVTGLVGSGLELVNGSDELAITQDGTFTFPTKVKSKGAFHVTIGSGVANPQQTCTITGGQGTVTNADVTVAVACVTDTFKLGGTIQGLADGRTLTLFADGIGSKSFGANGAFTLSSLIDSGSSYDVEVTQQPAGQTCTVTNGQGTITTADVANVLVQCVMNEYTVGGSVSGLGATDAIELTLNGDEALAVDANGTFQFQTKLVSGTSYEVTVSDATAGLTCSITGAKGQIASAHVTGVRVTCSTATQAVGGTVSGLDGTLVLQLNGAFDKTLTADGAFAFSAALAQGSLYEVTVKTQPADQICTIENASGTVGTEDVANVAVTCAASAFTVGGTVTGLEQDEAVVLTLDIQSDVDQLTVSQNGAFTFTSKLDDGTRYSVAVKTAPAGKACGVTGGNGTIAGANVSGVAVSCAAIPTYAVKAGVTGLEAGDTLVLQNNGGDDLAVTEDGAAAFARQLESGQAYAVTVKTAPEGKKCKVQDGAGVIGSADVTATVTCKVDVASPFPNVWVVRVGDGEATLGNGSAVVQLDEYSGDADDGLVRAIELSGITLGGTLASEGSLSRSGDGRLAVLAGYDAEPGVPTVRENISTARKVVAVNASGAIHSQALMSYATAFTKEGARGATTHDGTGFWVAGNGQTNTGGVHYVAAGSAGESTRVVTAPNNARWVHAIEGQLYGSAGSSPHNSVFSIGSGLQTAAGQTATVLCPVTGSPHGFALVDMNPAVPGVDTLYLALDTGTSTGLNVRKCTFDGTKWTAASFSTTGAATQIKGLAAYAVDGVARVYATTNQTSANKLVMFEDDGSGDALEVVEIATAPAKTVFRGVAFAPAE